MTIGTTRVDSSVFQGLNNTKTINQKTWRIVASSKGIISKCLLLILSSLYAVLYAVILL